MEPITLESLNPHLIIETYKQGYKVNGTYLPRVTSILASAWSKPGLLVWSRREGLKLVREEFRKFEDQTIKLTSEFLDNLISRADREPDRQKDEAGDFGTRAHAAFHAIAKGEEIEIDQDLIPCIERYQAWIKDCGLRFRIGEIRVASLKHGYAGTVDSIWTDGDNLVLGDYKTSKSIHGPEYTAQVGAYCQAWKETFGEIIKSAWILRVPKETPPIESPTVEFKQIADLDAAFKLFLAAKEIYESTKREWFL